MTKYLIDPGTLTIESNGNTLTYSPKTDRRIAECVDGKIMTKTLKGARELAGELQAWGVKEARAFNYAVVFW